MQSANLGLNIAETILARRSVRSYRKENLDRKLINMLLEAAVHAPTAMHQEPWAFVIVQDRKILRSLSERAKPLFSEELKRAGVKRESHVFGNFANPDFNIFHDAGTLIIICAKSDYPYAAADCWLAAENLMLAACATGLGTCVIGSALSAMNTQEFKVQLGIPAEYSAIAPIIVGYPRSETPSTSRREPLILAWRAG